MNDRTRRNRRYLTPICGAIALALAGCSDVPGLDRVTGLFSSDKGEGPIGSVAGAGDQTAGGPIKFTVGDRYTYDNPVERWEVVSIRGDRVYWRSDLGERQITGFNPLLPPQEWFGRTRGKGRRLIRDTKGALFPLKVGAALEYRSTVTTDRPPFGWEHKWKCAVTGTETVKTLGGPFETFVIKCGHKQPKLVTYHYAPKVGNYLVRRVKDPDGGLDSVRSLLSFERADGTVVAGIVPDRAAQATQQQASAAKSSQSKAVQKAPPNLGKAPSAKPKQTQTPVPKAEKAVSSPPRLAKAKLAPSKPAAAPVADTKRTINPPSGTAAGVTVPDALASLTLSEPKFGGRATPPTPLPEKNAGRAPAARSALVPPVTRRPFPRTAPKPVARPVVAKKVPAAPRGSRVPPPSVLGPRAVAPGRRFSSRARVPVPPPPIVAKPSVPAPKPARVPPPPIAAKPAPMVPKPPTAAPPPPGLSGGSVVYLASYRSQAAAKQGWTALKDKHGDLLNGLKPEVRQVEVTGKGTYYRLYAGPVSPTSVAGLCRELNGRGAFCAPAS